MAESDNSSGGAPRHDPVDSGHDLGLAGRITRSFIDSPLSPLLMFAALGIGVLGLLFTPRQEDPQISVPMIDIFVSYPGTSAEQVTSLVTEPLERIMSEIPGIRHVYSASQRGQAIVTVRFKVGEDLGNSIVKVHDKLQSNIDRIPPGVTMPLVKPKGIDDVAVVTITMWSESIDDGAMRTLALDTLQRLQEVPDTGQGYVVGGRTEQIRVEVFPERLSGFGIGLDEIASAIRAANSEQPAGNIESGNSSFSVYTGSFLRNASEVSRLVIAVRNGSPVYLRDIAQVFHGPEETKQMVSYYTGPAYQGQGPQADGQPAVTIALAKKEGSNGVTVAKAILARLDQLKGQLIPDNVHLEITRDYGKTANDKVNELLTALAEASAAVAILCLIGLGARAAFVVITVIPVVVLITVWSAWILDYTVDRVSLFALIFAIGILVDDATVVVENIFRRWLLAGRTTIDIAVDAVREVGNPTILATLTIISALLPMGFISGMMGPYMRPIPVLGSSAMFFSLLAAFIFTPWLAWKVRPKLGALKRAERREEKARELVTRFYRPIITPLIENRRLGLAFLVGLIGATFLSCALFYTQSVTVKMLPFDNKPEFNVIINMPDGTALPVTANVSAEIAAALDAMAEVTALQSYVGTASPFNFNGLVRHSYLRQQPWQADIQVMLVDKGERERSSHEIAEAARALLKPIAVRNGAKIQVVEMPPGPPVLQTVVAEVYGPDARTRRQVALDLTRMFEAAPGIVDVDNLMSDPHEYWRFEIDRQKADRRGISVDTVNRNLAMAMGGYKLGDVKRAAPLEPTYIVIQTPLAVRSQLSRLSNLPIMGVDGTSIPLAEVGRFVPMPEDAIIYHTDLRPMEYVTGEMEGHLGAPIYGMFDVEDQLEQYTAPDGVKFSGMPMGLIGPPADSSVSGIEWTGEWTVTYETFRDMGLAFMAALVLIYGLIVWESRNFAISGLIMAPIPLTLIGIIPGHWIMGVEFTATSMIGFIALAGIIVRNSILLVEFVRLEVDQGRDIREAAIAAGCTRLRPIFITSLTLMAGAAAILQDPIFQGMAVTLLFGAGVATMLTLLVIPMGCISAEKQFIGEAALDNREDDEAVEVPATADDDRTPLWLNLWSRLIAVLTMVFYLVRAVIILLVGALQSLWRLVRPDTDQDNGQPPPGGGGTPPTPPAGPKAGGGTTASAAAPAGGGAGTVTRTSAVEDVPEGPAKPRRRTAQVRSRPARQTNRRNKTPAKATDKTTASAGRRRTTASGGASNRSSGTNTAGTGTGTAASSPQSSKAAAAGTARQTSNKTSVRGAGTRKRRGIRIKEDLEG